MGWARALTEEEAEEERRRIEEIKRALDPLHQAQAGLEAVAPKRLLPDEVLCEARRELFEIRVQ
jgi:hypothetical protein